MNFRPLASSIKWAWIARNRRFQSQCGEDEVLAKLFSRRASGFYIDIGAFHPIRFSNTLYFYRLGWRGVNIEPNPSSFWSFRLLRPRDRNLNYGVSKSKATLKYFCFREAALNTFQESVAKLRERQGFAIRQIRMIPTLPLADILDQESVEKIDFMNIDTEGYELDVLQSNNWERFRPEVIVVEMIDQGSPQSQEIHKLLDRLGYTKYQTLDRSGIYIESGSPLSHQN